MSVTNPSSARQRVINYVKSRPGEEVEAEDVMNVLGIDRTLANTTLCGLKGLQGLSRVRIGVYCYDTTTPDTWVSGSNGRSARKRKARLQARTTTPALTDPTTPTVLAVPKGLTEVGTLVKDDQGNFMVIRRIPTQAVRHLI